MRTHKLKGSGRASLRNVTPFPKLYTAKKKHPIKIMRVYLEFNKETKRFCQNKIISEF